MKQIVGYGMVYLLWAITTVLGILAALVVRNTYELVLATTGWHRYTLSAIDKFGTFFLAVVLLLLLVFTEHYYRTGVEFGQLPARFCQITAIQFGVLALSHLVRVLVEQAYGLSSAAALPLLAGEGAGVLLFGWLAHRLKRQPVHRGLE